MTTTAPALKGPDYTAPAQKGPDYRVLAVDDEPQTTPALGTVLTAQGYQVRARPDGESAWSSFCEWRPHLVLTDLCMARVDGVELCRRIRAISRVPILVLSARTAERVKVEALDAGADDYLSKPFGVQELLARVRALLRRGSNDWPCDGPLETGDFRINLSTRRVEVRDRAVHLTPKEFDLLVYLARRPGCVIEHRRLLEAIWGEAGRGHSEYLRVFIGQLRKKLEIEPSTPQYVATEPWVGYRFNPRPVTD